MPTWSQEKFNLYSQLIGFNQKDILSVMSSYLRENYNDIEVTDDYIYALGDIPIALAAHLDTVFEEDEKDTTFQYNGKSYVKPKRKPELYYDQWQDIIACPQGAGHDDRAGVFAIINLIEEGFRPSIILTTDEEIGGVGARKFVNKVKEPRAGERYIIQLDRRGVDDCVFYDLESKPFEQYVEAFGFKTNWGSFSDISVICPAWGIAGVNLSIGYVREHTVEEILYVDAWEKTYKRVKTMLQEKDIPFFKYERVTPLYQPYGGYYDDWDYGYGYDNDSFTVECAHCNQTFDIFETMPVVEPSGKAKHYCVNCYSAMEQCLCCGELFYKKRPHWKYCRKCSKEVRKFGRKNKTNK